MEFIAVFAQFGIVIVFGHDAEFLQWGHAGIGHYICFKVKHALNIAQRHVEHEAQTRWQRFQEPDVGARCGQIDVAHALAAHLGLRDFNTALLANHTTVLEALVFAAEAFIVFDGAKNLGTKKTIALRLEGAVVDRLGFFHFAERPAADLLWGGYADTDGIEMLIRGELLEEVK